MRRRRSRYLPIMFDGRSRRRRRGKILFFVILGIVVVTVVLCLIFSPEPQPFQNVTPVVTSLPTPEPTVEPESPEADATTQEPEETAIAENSENPVLSLLDGYQEAYRAAEVLFDEVAEVYPLRLVGFRLASGEVSAAVTELYDVFATLQRGEEPGAWNGEDIRIFASGGSYVLQAEFSDGTTLEGGVNSTATKMYVNILPQEGGTPVRSLEIVQTNSGYYVRFSDVESIYQNISLATNAFGLSCAMTPEAPASIYENAPVNQEGFFATMAEVFQATEGGGVVTINGEDAICSKH